MSPPSSPAPGVRPAAFRFRCIACGDVSDSAAQNFRCAQCGDLLEITYPRRLRARSANTEIYLAPAAAFPSAHRSEWRLAIPRVAARACQRRPGHHAARGQHARCTNFRSAPAAPACPGCSRSIRE